MPDYTKGKIYTIRFNESNEIYIGSTTQPLAVRFGEHKRKKDSSVSKLINEKYNGDWCVCYYELYESFSCNNKEELNKKEGEIIRIFKNDENYICINKSIAGRTHKEYYDINKEKLNEKHRIYYDINKEKEKERKRIYYENNKEKLKEKIGCECGGCYTYKHKARHFKTKKHQDYVASKSSST